MPSDAIKSRSLVRDGRSFRASWYVQSNGLFFVGVTVTNGKNTPVTCHLAHATEDSAEKFVEFQMRAFLCGIDTEREL